MRLLRRILITAAITVAVIGLGVYWIAPVALSFNAARTATTVERVAPADLKDFSISDASGRKFSYFGYEFEIPRNDLDESHITLVPKDNPYMVGLIFRSGLVVLVSASPPRVFPFGFAHGFKPPPQNIEQGLERVFGHQAMQSDYEFVKNLYQFTPDKMHFWALSPSVHYREQMVLLLKGTVASPGSAETGIFNVGSRDYRGFQLGDPKAHARRVAVHLYSDEGSIEFTFGIKDPNSPAAITQPEINRVVQSLHKKQADTQH